VETLNRCHHSPYQNIGRQFPLSWGRGPGWAAGKHMGNTLKLDIHGRRCGLQRLGVYVAEASAASRSGVNTKTLRAVDGAEALHIRLDPDSFATGPTHIDRRTHCARVDLPEFPDQYVRKVHHSFAASYPLESHIVANECFSYKSLTTLPFDLPIAPDPPHDPMSRIPYRFLPSIASPPMIYLYRRSLCQPFVGSHMIVGSNPPIRPSLLRSPIARCRTCRFGLQHPMHLLVRAVLFGMARCDKFDSNPQRRPPGAQPRKPRRACGSKGTAVVYTDHFRVAVSPKNSEKFSADRPPTLVPQQANAQQIATEQIPYSQWFYTATILRAKPTLEIDRPHMIGPPRYSEFGSFQTRATTSSSPACPPIQSHPFEPIADRPNTGDPIRSMCLAQARRQLPAAPTGMATTQSPNPLQPFGRYLSRTSPRSAGTILQAPKPLPFETLDPFVACSAAQSKLSAQLAQVSLGLAHQLHKLQPPNYA
jgi:hypothetical protein